VEERQERIERKEDWKHDGIIKGNETFFLIRRKLEERKEDRSKVRGYENLPLKTKYKHALEITKNEHDLMEMED
jgi:hypothetical protein